MVEAALLCLALNVYFEARGEPFLGQYAVAQVTLNRAEHDPRKVCRAVYAPGQFSWTAQRPAMPTDAESWRTAKRIAQLALRGELADYTDGATHFHAPQARPNWRYVYKRTATFGNHIFYKQTS